MACGCVGSPNSSGITRGNDCGYCNKESEKKQRYISKDSFTTVIDVYIYNIMCMCLEMLGTTVFGS